MFYYFIEESLLGPELASPSDSWFVERGWVPNLIKNFKKSEKVKIFEKDKGLRKFFKEKKIYFLKTTQSL